MYFASDLYHPQANRYVHSESYFNPNEKINITENRLGCQTFNPNHVTSMSPSHAPFGTIRKNRLKLLRNPNFRISFGDGKSSNSINGDLNDSNGNVANAGDSQYNGQEQLYVKIGEMNPMENDSDYNGMRWLRPQMVHHQDLQSQQMQLQQVQSQQQQQLHQLPHKAHSNHSIYENHQRQNSADKDMIYAPSGNRSIISCMSNKRFDDV